MAVGRAGVPGRVGINRILHDAFSNEHGRLYRAVRRAVVLTVLYATGAMTLDSIEGIHTRYWGFFRISEAFVVGVFLLEYAGKVYVASPRRKYIFGAWGIIDLLSVVTSSYFSGPLDLRVFYVVRVLKLAKVVADDWAKIRTEGLGSLGKALRVYLLAMFTVLMVGSVLVYYAEGGVHDTAFRDIVATMWWGVGALTPLDSGMSPLTILGRVIAAATSVCGLALFAFLIHIVGAALSQSRSTD